MKSLFWIATNIVGFIFLVFVYANERMTGKGKTLSQRLTRYLHLSVLLFLIADTGMFLLDGTLFMGANVLHHISTALFYITTLFPVLIYLIYCDRKVFKDEDNGQRLKKRIALYSIPAAVNAILVLLNPLTGMLYSIDGNNVYARGEYFWLSTLLAFIYIVSVIPLLAIKTKNKERLSPKGSGIYLYLFPIPPVVLSVIQNMLYGVSLVSIGLVASVYLLYFTDVQLHEGKRSIFSRFLNTNIIQFLVVVSVIILSTFWYLNSITEEISVDYATYNSAETASILKAYLDKEIGIMTAAARSKAVANWLRNEDDQNAKQQAFYELHGSAYALYDDNIYIVVKKSGQEYWLRSESDIEDFQARGTVSPDNEEDAWVYELMAMPYEYILNVDNAKGTDITDVWINIKVIDGDETVGILATRLDLSTLIVRVLRALESDGTRMLIIDENRVIQIDSTLIVDGYTGVFFPENAGVIDTEVPYSEFLEALTMQPDELTGVYPDTFVDPMIVRLNRGQYGYAALTPIGQTSWTVVMLYSSTSLFNIARLLPLFIIIAAMFLLYVFTSNGIVRRYMFTPLKKLVDSIVSMRSDSSVELYGIHRNDEVGLLSNAIKEYFVKGYFDELTGIHNRRYFETTLQQTMGVLSRYNAKLSVLMIDIDNFKKYNDTYGHAEGDNCLRSVAEAINDTITRKGDFVARYGGEEFVVVLPGTDRTGAELVANNLLKAVRELKIPHEKNEPGIVTISIGVASGEDGASINRDHLLKKADDALYLAKTNGRNQAYSAPPVP